MGMFDISEETEREYTEKFRAMAQEKVDEPVIAVGPFRRGGAASSFAISKGQLGGLVYAANSLRNKKKAGGLPQSGVPGRHPEQAPRLQVQDARPQLHAQGRGRSLGSRRA